MTQTTKSRAAYQREYRAQLSPERKEARLANRRERYANLSPEQKEARLEYDREYNTKRTPEPRAGRYAKLTPEQKAARAAHIREWRLGRTKEQKAVGWARQNAKVAQERKDPEHWARHRLLDIKKRCKKKGLDFDLTESDLVLTRFCPVLGIPIYLGLAGTDYNSIHVDRVDNGKGYIKGNIQIISGRANYIKKDTTLKEIEAVAKYMREHQ